MTLTILGAVLLVVGGWAAYATARQRDAAPAPGWFADPQGSAVERRWDGRTWTAQTRPAGPDVTARGRGRRFRGRFWGGWVWYLAAAVVVLAVGSGIYTSVGDIQYMGVASLVAMALVSWAFYTFVDNQLALHDVISLREVAAVVVATAGAVLLVAANVNTAVIDSAGVSTATALVGFVEEGTKLLVPLVLFLLGRYRDPRAGVAIGLASGFGFAIVETTQYAYQTASATGPALCGSGVLDATPARVVQEQVFRIFTVSPLHWLWTGIAVAIAWRMWHLHGRRGTPRALAGILLVMVVHSLNDSSVTATCDSDTASSLAALARWGVLIAMYLTFKAWSRKSTPPQLVGSVSRGWHPKNLGSDG